MKILESLQKNKAQVEKFEPTTKTFRGRRHRIISFMALAWIFALLATLISVASIASASASSSSSSSLDSNCTVTVVSGKCWVKTTSGYWEGGFDGMVLKAGDLIKTGAESKALLTFFEGSVITLESNTEIEIEQLGKADEGYNTILVRQILGRTWSLVEKMTDVRSRYEVHTPSAVAAVRGTSFIVDVNNEGATHVGVTEGLVAVSGQGAEVSVPAGFESEVSASTQPSEPAQIDPGIMQNYPGHKGDQGKDNSQSNNNGKADNNSSTKSIDNSNGTENSNAGGNSENSNAGGNSENSNAGGNSNNSNAGGNSENSNAGGNSNNSNGGGNGWGNNK